MAFSRLLGVTLTLHFRNKMALLYGHLFPAIVLLAFLGLYSYEAAPLARHLGELLTITALSGACFGLSTTLVGERERGIWRHYSLTPIPLRGLLLPTLLARFCLLLIAGAVQLALALAVGTPLPAHPVQLAIALAFVAFAFVGLGLVLSMLADTVNGAQALGQCVFLPMLVIGGVAVRVEALPEWARRLSAYLPGRYAVEAIQACVTGSGLAGMGFHLLALVATGAAALVAGASMFRWSSAEVRVPRAAKLRVVGALAVWIAVGYLATSYGPYASASRPRGAAAGADSPAIAAASGRPAPHVSTDSFRGSSDPAGSESDSTLARSAAGEAVVSQPIDHDIDYSKLPPDDGLVAPFARADEPVPPEVSEQLECMRMMIPGWGPARVADPVQKVRNHLFVAAVPDVYQTGDLERWIPLVVAERLESEFPPAELASILHRIATHPDEGDMAAAGSMSGVCFERAAPADREQLKERVTFYALKLLGRTTGRLPRQ